MEKVNSLDALVTDFFKTNPNAQSVISVGDSELFLSSNYSAAYTHSVRNKLPLQEHKNPTILADESEFDDDFDFEKDEINEVDKASDVDIINEATTAEDSVITSEAIEVEPKSDVIEPELPKPSKKITPNVK
jgi:hypothetical protein